MTTLTINRAPTEDEQTILAFANGFATCAHTGQTRRDSTIPYITHAQAVAATVWKHTSNVHATVAAFLHDVIEDTDVTLDDLRLYFEKNITELVLEVTDTAKPEDGNRKARLAINALHLNKASSLGATIKLADIKHNTSDIRKSDPKFAKQYLQEKLDILPLISHGDITLYKAVEKQILNELDQIRFDEVRANRV